MYCPDYTIVRNNIIVLTMHSDRDVLSKYVPKTQWFNPFRYQVSLFYKKEGGYRYSINKEGRAHITLSNFIFRIKAKLRMKRTKP